MPAVVYTEAVRHNIGCYTRRFAGIAFADPMATRYMSHTNPSLINGKIAQLVGLMKSSKIRKRLGQESLFGSAVNNPEQKTCLQREIKATDRQTDQWINEKWLLSISLIHKT